jgi:hypothetical protein
MSLYLPQALEAKQVSARHQGQDLPLLFLAHGTQEALTARIVGLLVRRSCVLVLLQPPQQLSSLLVAVLCDFVSV